MLAYQIKSNGVWTGATMDVAPADGLGAGWVRADAPPELAVGQVAIFAGDSWIIADEEPAVVQTVPIEVTMRQARLALHAAGKLVAVDAAINALPDPPKTAALIEWEYSNAVRRDSQFVALLGPALGLDAAGLDALFIAASKLSA
jgi:hypothetical protein